MFLTNSSKDLYASTLCIMLTKITSLSMARPALEINSKLRGILLQKNHSSKCTGQHMSPATSHRPTERCKLTAHHCHYSLLQATVGHCKNSFDELKTPVKCARLSNIVADHKLRPLCTLC